MSDRVNEARMKVLRLMKHEAWCAYAIDGSCTCEAGQRLIDLLATERATAAVDVEQVAHHLHELGKYGDDFGGNNCDCTERARQIMRSIPLGYRLARLSGESER